MIGNDEKAAARAAIEAQIARIAEAEREARRPPPRLVIEENGPVRPIKRGELISLCTVDYEYRGVVGNAIATRDISPDELYEKVRQIGASGMYEFCENLIALLVSEGAATKVLGTDINVSFDWNMTDGDVLCVDLAQDSAEKDSEENDI